MEVYPTVRLDYHIGRDFAQCIARAEKQARCRNFLHYIRLDRFSDPLRYELFCKL